ncbi:MAG: RNase H family protein [Dehalococcoidia bacterium]
MSCRKGPRSAPRTTEAALTAYTAGPQDGIFTDGGCDPNPGPGGWGAVKVIDGEITDERHGHAPNTTNNQMELRALIEAFKMAGPDEEIAVYSDSQYCVSTINIWG